MEHQEGGQLAQVLADSWSSACCQAACILPAAVAMRVRVKGPVHSAAWLILPAEQLSSEVADGEHTEGW